MAKHNPGERPAKRTESPSVDINTINFVLSSLEREVSVDDIISQLTALGRKEEEVETIFKAAKNELARRKNEEGEEGSVEVPTSSQVQQIQQQQLAQHTDHFEPPEETPPATSAPAGERVTSIEGITDPAQEELLIRQAAEQFVQLKQGKKSTKELLDSLTIGGWKIEAFNRMKLVAHTLDASIAAPKHKKEPKPTRNKSKTKSEGSQPVPSEQPAATTATQPTQPDTATPESDPAQLDPAAQKAEELRKKKEREAIQDNAYWMVREKAKGRSEESLAESLAKVGITAEAIEKTREMAASIEARNAEATFKKVERETADEIVRQWQAGVPQEEIEAKLKDAGWKEEDIPSVVKFASVVVRIRTYKEAASVDSMYEASGLSRIKRSYDPVYRFLEKIAGDERNKFETRDAVLTYRVSKSSSSTEPKRPVSQYRWEYASTYHDYLRLSAGTDLKLLHPHIVVDEKRFLNRLDDPNDPLHSYKEEWETLWKSIRRSERGEFPPDEYARAVQRGEVPSISDDFVIEKRKEKVPEEGIVAALKAAGWREEDIPFVQSVADAKPLPEVFEGRAFEMAKRYFDPLRQFLMNVSKIRKNNFRIGDARLEYGVGLAPEKDGGKIAWRTVINYHDFLRRLRSVPGRDRNRIHTGVSVEKEFQARLDNPDDPLHAYKAEFETLIQKAAQPKSVEDELIDEYARRAWRGDVYLEVPEDAHEPLAQEISSYGEDVLSGEVRDELLAEGVPGSEVYDSYLLDEASPYFGDRDEIPATLDDVEIPIVDDGDDEPSSALTPQEESEEVASMASEGSSIPLSAMPPERLTAREIEDLKRSYDPMFRLLKRMSEDPEVDFKAEDAHLNYGVFIPSRDEEGKINGRAETATSYHDLMQLRASIPEELRRESDPLVWNWKIGGTWGKIATFANGEKLWDRLENPDDKLSKYRDEVYALIEQIKDERLPDEYAEAVERGEINVQEIPEWNVYGAYGDLRAMYNGEPIPDDIEQKYDSVYQRVRAAEYHSDEMDAAIKEMRALVQEQWDVTRGTRASAMDYDEWSRRVNSFESQHRNLDLMRLFPEGKYPHSLSDRTYEYRNEFIKALNAGDEAKMAEITAAADEFFAEQRIAAAEAHRTPVEQKEIPFDEVEAIVREQLGGKAKINRLTIDSTPEGLQLHAELDAGMMGGEIVLDGTIVNDGNTIAIHGLDIDARGYVKSMIQDKLGNFDTAIKAYFEKKFGKQVSKMQIGDAGLTLEFGPAKTEASTPEEAQEGLDNTADQPDTPLEWRNTLKSLIEGATLKMNAGERSEKMKSYLAGRAAELGQKAKELGPGTEKFVRMLGTTYDKMGWKSKLAIGASLGLGAAAFSSVSTPLALLFGAGLGAQRLAGMSSMFLKIEKYLQDHKGSNIGMGPLRIRDERIKGAAAFGAVAYTALMGAAIAEGVDLASESAYGQAVHEWLGNMMGHQAAPSGVKASQPVPPPASEAPGVPAPAAEVTPPSPEPEISHIKEIDVKASKGHGYEYMTKRLWEQLQEKNIKLPSGANPDSDLAKLLAADKDSIDRVVHKLAQENEFFKNTGQSVRIDLDSHMTIDAKGNISITGSDLAPEGTHQAPEGSPLTPPYQPGAVPRPEAAAPDLPPDMPATASEGPAGVAGTTASEITVDQHPSPDILIENQSPAPVIERDFVVNKFDVTVPLAEPHIYAGPPGTNQVFAYGGEKMVRLNAMFDYLKTHPNATVIAEDDSGKYRSAWTLVKDRLVQGERLPQRGFFGRLSGALLPPPGPDELSKLIK